MHIPGFILKAGGKILIKGGGKLFKKGIFTILSPAAVEILKKFWGKDPGSKVLLGDFFDCSIEMFGNTACIVVDKEQGKVVFLTSDEIASGAFVKKKFNPKTMKWYYYYTISFKDGRQSYVRVSKKPLSAMLKHIPNLPLPPKT